MKRLMLLRHAKARRNSEDGTDAGRSLNKRGLRNAEAMGQHMQVQGFVPELVISSDAARTRETTELVSGGLTPQPQIMHTEALYLASPRTILQIARQTDDAIETTMLVGHNPGMADLSWSLVAEQAEPDELSRLRAFPTCALAVIDLDIDHWRDADNGKLIHYVIPADLDPEE